MPSQFCKWLLTSKHQQPTRRLVQVTAQDSEPQPVCLELALAGWLAVGQHNTCIPELATAGSLGWCSTSVLLCVACVPAEVHTALPSHSASLRLAKKMCSAAKVRGINSSPAPSRHCAPAATAAGWEGPSLPRGILGLFGTGCFCTPVLKVGLVLAFPSHSPCRPKHSTSARPLYCALQLTPTCIYQLQRKQGRYPASSSCCLQHCGVCFGTSSRLD
jgi:hypothetical protein